jgi:hypothetical protein
MIVVSGIPRSGTSMLMQMLDSGGIEIVTDGERKADEDNPEGYYELDSVKGDDTAWAESIDDNSAVKVVSFHLPKLKKHIDKIIFVTRDLNEVYASSNKMLKRRGKEKLPDKIIDIWREHIDNTVRWINDGGISCLIVGHRDIIENPHDCANRINKFLGTAMDVNKMSSVVSRDLYRNRS